MSFFPPLYQLFPVPLDILEEIFLNLPPDQVVHSCRLVCHEWKEVADRQSLWRERCRREGYHLPDTSKTPKDWRLFYFLCKKRRNLIKNPRGERKCHKNSFIQHLVLLKPLFPATNLTLQYNLSHNPHLFIFIDKMKYWQILQNGGDMWKIEGLMVPHPDETVQKNFVTSYGLVFTRRDAEIIWQIIL